MHRCASEIEEDDTFWEVHDCWVSEAISFAIALPDECSSGDFSKLESCKNQNQTTAFFIIESHYHPFSNLYPKKKLAE